MALLRKSVKTFTTGAILCLVIVTGVCFLEVSATTRPEDVSALRGLLTTWSAPSLNWNGDPCQNSWTGVTCDATNTTVIELLLQNQQIQGTLGPAIGGLNNLTTLELSRNSALGGQLPQELGNLNNLEYLSLQWCSFSGSIPPELGNLVKLTFLGLNGNQLNGTIPFTLGNLTHLTWLDISTNSISGTIPVSSTPGSNGIGLNNMTSVGHLHFNNNSLTGSIPPEIFSLPSLIHLILNHNNMDSPIPDEIGNADNLTILRLDYNNFDGDLPTTLSNVSTILYINLNHNKFTGALPDLSGLKNLQLLDIGQNNFVLQDSPTWLPSLSSMQTLNLAGAGIQGTMPPELLTLPLIEYLNFSRNQLNGSLEFIGDTSSSLQALDLTYNNFIGFSGEPENQDRTLTSLQIFLEGNPICDNTYLSFQRSICGADILSYSFKAHASNCSTSACKDGKSSNPKDCTCAYPLAISLVLTAPPFTNLTDERIATIESEIAKQLTDRNIIQLEQNQVVVSSGFLTDAASYQLNLLFFPLVGDTLTSSDKGVIVNALNQRRITLAEGPFQVPNINDSSGSGRSGIRLSAGAIFGIAAGGILFALILVGFAVREKRRADNVVVSQPFASWGAGTAEFGEAPQLKGARYFSLAELKAATNNWDPQNEIGQGGYGKVYRGVLKSGDVVAIKRAREGSMQGAVEFKNEIELLSRVHHRNLVGLVGFCYESGEQALIYEFLGNGSLREHLIGSGARTRLTWEERLNIAVGAARGLEYLHEHANPPIIHRDVKSANILFNERNVAKVADFGLSKLAPDEGEKKVYSETIKGTLGYLDPEYYTRHQLTDKSDVYSFGVVLLELLTARNPIERGTFIVREIRVALDKGGLTALRPLLDPVLKDLSNEKVEAYLKIALSCVEESGAARPSMVDIVKDLEALGAQSYPSSLVDIHTEGKTFNDDTEALFPSSRSSKGDRSFDYSGVYASSTLRSSFRAVASRLQSPVAGRPFSPISQSSQVDLL